MKVEKDSLGNRQKWYEGRYTLHTLMPMIPVMARIDGRCFSTFTKGLKKPYDERLSRLMIDTTKHLVEQTDARCGYTQSDEITLTWLAENDESELLFGGKLLKIVSVVGAIASVYFNKELASRIPEKAKLSPVFDNRAWEMPSLREATSNFLWREIDATKNSVSSAVRCYYSHSQVHKKNRAERMEMLFQKGVNWNDYPNYFKRGTYVRRRVLEREFTTEELKALPAKHHAHMSPDLKVRRSVVMAEDFPPLTKIVNREDVIFFGADPVLASDV